MSSITIYLLALNYVIGDILLSLPYTPDDPKNTKRIAIAIIVHLITTFALLVRGTKEIWADVTKKE